MSEPRGRDLSPGAPNRRRLVADPVRVLEAIAERIGSDVDTVAGQVAVFREAVDDLLASGAVVATGELLMSLDDNPTWRAVQARLEADDPVPEEVLAGDPGATAAWLGLGYSDYTEHPLTNRPHVMLRIVEILLYDDPDVPALWPVLDAWDASFADGRDYRMSTAGLEAAAERWLVEHLPRLRLHGYPVDLVGTQYVLPSGKRPDLLCRFNDTGAYGAYGAAAGDWLVVELKATRFYPAAAAQLTGYLAEVADHVGDGRAVHGLFVTDGATHEEVQALRADGLGHLSLATLGYRLQLAQGRGPALSGPGAEDPDFGLDAGDGTDGTDGSDGSDGRS